MKNIILILVLILSIFKSDANANPADSYPAKMTIEIRKYTYAPNDNGLPNFKEAIVCSKQASIQVYKNSSASITPEELHLVQCDSEIAGNATAVLVGGIIKLSQDSQAAKSVAMKSVILVLSWGVSDHEIPQISQVIQTDSWTHFKSYLVPVSTGKIVHGVPQEPEPKEFFGASVSIDDASPAAIAP